MARPTIAQLEAILENEEQVEIEILPNGEVRSKGGTSAQELGGRKLNKALWSLAEKMAELKA